MTLSARPAVIDLFSGAGGMSLGFEQAGFDVVAAVEVDPIHAAVHKFNFPNSTVIARSVVGLTGEYIREAAGLGSRKITAVIGGPPCQGFSMIGQRALDDPRNSLVQEFVRLVSELQPDYFVFENVKGLTVGRHIQFLHELVDAFSKQYEVTPWRVLNAANFGVPQSRERLILMGGRRGLPPPQYPTETTRLPRQVLPLPLAPTCKEALGDLPDIDDFDELLARDSARAKCSSPSAFAAKLRAPETDTTDYSYGRVWDPELLTSSLRTLHTLESRARFTATKPGTVEPISRFFKLPPDGISNTLRAGTDSARGAFTSPRPIHFRFARCISVREMMRLHGFPDWFRMHQTKWHGARQVGNAVPPPLAKAVACSLFHVIGVPQQKPQFRLALDHEGLLSLDMSGASKHFGVTNPIAQRLRQNLSMQEVGAKSPERAEASGRPRRHGALAP